MALNEAGEEVKRMPTQYRKRVVHWHCAKKCNFKTISVTVLDIRDEQSANFLSGLLGSVMGMARRK